MNQPNAQSKPTSLARSCGECVGHILKAIRTPAERPRVAPLPECDVRTVGAAIREERVGDVLHRRIVIDQVVAVDPAVPLGLDPIS